MLGVYHLLLFSDFVSDPYLKFNLGWSLNLLVIAQILINTFVITTMSVLSLVRACRMRLKCKFKVYLLVKLKMIANKGTVKIKGQRDTIADRW